MYIAKVYKIMIGAPSDIQDEIGIAKDVIQKWKQETNIERRKAKYLVN